MTKKTKAISTRTAAVHIEYDFRKDGVVERRRKFFESSDSKEARAFFVEKMTKNKNPKVIGDGDTKASDRNAKRIAKQKEQTDNYMALANAIMEPNKEPNAIERHLAESKAEPRAKSLVEAFPPEPVDPNAKQLIRATGDETKTEVVEPATEPAKTEPAVGKGKRRKNKKNMIGLWASKTTRTVVGVKWVQPKNGVYPRWLVKFSDKTEVTTSRLTVIHSREHADHHLAVCSLGSPDELCYDKMSNKDYEEVLRRSADYYRKAAGSSKQLLQNFRSQASPQKEMGKAMTKKMIKEEPLTDEEKALAKSVAEIANKLCVVPASFVMLPAQHVKLNRKPEDFELDKYGLDELKVTMRIIQYATRLHRQMAPRIDVGGAPLEPGQGGLWKEPETKEEEKAAKQAERAQRKAEKAAKKAEPKTPKEVDAFGNRVGTETAEINAAIISIGDTEFDLDDLMKKTGFPRGRFSSHLRTLTLRGFIFRTKDGWRRVGKKDVKGSEKSEAPKAKEEPKAKPSKKPAQKAPAKGKAGKGKPAKKSKKARK